MLPQSFDEHLPGDDSDLRRAIACKACAKAKTKCDKLTPSCTRCTLKGVQCQPRKTKRPTDTAERQARRIISMQQGPVKIAAATSSLELLHSSDFGPHARYQRACHSKTLLDRHTGSSINTSSSTASRMLSAPFGYTVPSPAISTDGGDASSQCYDTPPIQQEYTPPAEGMYPTPYVADYSSPYSTFDTTTGAYVSADSATTHTLPPSSVTGTNWQMFNDPVCIESDIGSVAGGSFFPQSTLAPDLLSTVIFSRGTGSGSEHHSVTDTQYASTATQYTPMTAAWSAFYEPYRATDFMNHYTTY